MGTISGATTITANTVVETIVIISTQVKFVLCSSIDHPKKSKGESSFGGFGDTKCDDWGEVKWLQHNTKDTGNAEVITITSDLKLCVIIIIVLHVFVFASEDRHTPQRKSGVLALETTSKILSICLLNFIKPDF